MAGMATQRERTSEVEKPTFQNILKPLPQNMVEVSRIACSRFEGHALFITVLKLMAFRSVT
jgi:hypothetical protein